MPSSSSEGVIGLEEVLIFVKELVCVTFLGEAYEVAEVVKHLLHELEGQLVCALSALGELLVVVCYLDLGAVQEHGIEGRHDLFQVVCSTSTTRLGSGH